MAAFEAYQNFSHPQLSPHCLDFLRVHLLLPALPFHASDHIFPILNIVPVGSIQLSLPKIDLLIQLLPVPVDHHIVEKHSLYTLLIVLHVDYVQLQASQISRRMALPLGIPERR